MSQKTVNINFTEEELIFLFDRLEESFYPMYGSELTCDEYKQKKSDLMKKVKVGRVQINKQEYYKI